MTDPAVPVVSIIVPVLDEEAQLPSLLEHLGALVGRFEVVIVDGGSRDASVAVARAYEHPGLRVLAAPRGRAAQMNAGACVARGDVLLFLHADTRLPPAAPSLIAETVADQRVCGGNFELSFDDQGRRFGLVLGRWYGIQRRLGVYYGDSAVWVRAPVFRGLGGFRELAIMEDYDFVRRLERHGPTVCLRGPAVTSARRWRALGVMRTVASWAVIRWLFIAGVPPERLARLYQHAR